MTALYPATTASPSKKLKYLRRLLDLMRGCSLDRYSLVRRASVLREIETLEGALH